MNENKAKRLANLILNHVVVPSIKIIWNIFLGFIAFLLLAKAYPYLPIIGGINRTEFSSQQLINTIDSYVGDSNYKIYQLDFIGFGEKNYLLEIDNSKRIYSLDYKRYDVAGNIKFIVLQEVQKNPIQQLIFSSNIYNKAYEITFPESELTFSNVIHVDGNKDKYIFCIDRSYCGSIEYKKGFQVLPLFREDSEFCHKNLKYKQVNLSRINVKGNTKPFFFFYENKNMVVAYPIEFSGANLWSLSARFQFCPYNYPYTEYIFNCFVTKEKYAVSDADNTNSGPLKDYFKKNPNLYEDLMFKKLDPCKQNDSL
jgi:hypothetical protein